MNLEDVLYRLFGTSAVVGPHIKRQLTVLSGILPPEFKNRATDDLGCGDGRITLMLEEIFRPSSLRGFDVNPSLVERTRRRGIMAKARDLDNDVPSGELAIMWGVLHHLADAELCLERIRANYSHIFIREPLKSSRLKLFELGRPMSRAELESTIGRVLPGARLYCCGNSVFIFYTSKRRSLEENVLENEGELAIC